MSINGDSWRYYEFEEEFGLSVGDLMDFSDSFSDWFTVFLEEKGLSNLVIEFENKQGWNYFPVQVIAEFLSSCPQEIQEEIRTKLTELDFCSADVSHFLEHVAKGIANF